MNLAMTHSNKLHLLLQTSPSRWISNATYIRDFIPQNALLCIALFTDHITESKVATLGKGVHFVEHSHGEWPVILASLSLLFIYENVYH